MRAHQLLNEHFVNLTTPEQKQKYADVVWDILQQSYASIGGFKGATGPEELVNTPGLWKLSRRNGKIVAVALYKDKTGRKAVAYGTDGSEQGKTDFRDIKDSDVKLNRMWVEASGAIEKIMSRAGAKPVPAIYAAALTGKEILDIADDGYHYTRLLQGHPHEKIIYGVVEVDDYLKAKLEDQGIDLRKLPDNIRLDNL